MKRNVWHYHVISTWHVRRNVAGDHHWLVSQDKLTSWVVTWQWLGMRSPHWRVPLWWKGKPYTKVFYQKYARPLIVMCIIYISYLMKRDTPTDQLLGNVGFSKIKWNNMSKYGAILLGKCLQILVYRQVQVLYLSLNLHCFHLHIPWDRSI